MAILEIAGLDVPVEPIESVRSQVVPLNGQLSCELARDAGIPTLRPWRSALQDCMTSAGLAGVALPSPASHRVDRAAGGQLAAAGRAIQDETKREWSESSKTYFCIASEWQLGLNLSEEQRARVALRWTSSKPSGPAMAASGSMKEIPALHTAFNRTSGETVIVATFFEAPEQGPLVIPAQAPSDCNI